MLRKTFITGYLAAAASAVLFSIKGIFAKKAYAIGATPEVLLGLRFGFALPVFGWIALGSREAGSISSLSRPDWTRVGILAGLGYILASLLDFRGLQYISVGLERIILYAHPTLVLILAVVLRGRPLRSSTLSALILSYLGLALCFFGEVHIGDPGRTLRGALLVLGSAGAYAVFLLGAERVVPRVGAHRLTALGMVLSGFFFGLQAIWNVGIGVFRLPAGVYAWSLILATVSTVLPVYLFGVGLKRMGAARLSIAGMIGPAASLPLAALILGESSGPWQWGGFVLTLAGGMLLLRRE
jgi:drug/metabolite transporter (DMT)-like permease